MNAYDETLFKGTAWYYARYRAPYPQTIFDLIRKKFSLDGTGRLLDLGAGTGELAVPFSQDVEEVVSVEPDPEMRAEGEQRAAKAGATNITWVNNTVEEYSDRPASVRLVTIGTALHWMEKDTVLEKIYELLAPGGGLAIVSGRSFWSSSENWKRKVVDVVKKYLGEERRAGKGTYAVDTRPYKEVIGQFPFLKTEMHQIKERGKWTIDEIIGRLYSTSFARRELFGERIQTFEMELTKALRPLNPTGTFTDDQEIQVILAWK